MKNLSSCCNAEVVIEMSGYPRCTYCGEMCDLASPEVIETNKEWESELKEEYNEYLKKKWKERGFESSPTDSIMYDNDDVEFWLSKLSTKEKDHISQQAKLVEKISEMSQITWRDYRDRFEVTYAPVDEVVGYERACLDILELINKDK